MTEAVIAPPGFGSPRGHTRVYLEGPLAA